MGKGVELKMKRSRQKKVAVWRSLGVVLTSSRQETIKCESSTDLFNSQFNAMIFGFHKLMSEKE